MAKWIGVDLDGTLARAIRVNGVAIGPPVRSMVNRVREWLKSGQRVKVLTARQLTDAQVREIRRFLENNGIGDCEITNAKDTDMAVLFDDKAVRVEKNSGLLCHGCASHASNAIPRKHSEDGLTVW